MAKRKICSGCGKMINFTERCSCRKEYKREYKKTNDDGFYSTRKWRKIRAKIIKRDGYKCKRCELEFDILNSDNLTVHHIKSRENYPELSYDESNLITVCQTCNNQLGTKDKLSFEWDYEEEERVYFI